MDKSNTHMVTLAGDRTLAVTNVGVGQRFIVRLTQDAIGSRSVTWWSNISWAGGGTPPSLTSAGNKSDLIAFLCTSAGNYDGYILGQNI
jgi:hypothetical protein